MATNTTQSKYRRKRKSEEQPSIKPNEVRIKGNQGNVRRYVDYACSLLEGRALTEREPKDSPQNEDDKQQQDDDKQTDQEQPTEKFDTIVLKATGRAINKAVTTAEVVKRRVPDLHQVTDLETLEITDVWEPLVQGLKNVETKRRVASISITLTRDEASVDKSSPGYQQPIPADPTKAFLLGSTVRPRRRRRPQRGGPRGGGGGGRGGMNRGRGARRGGPGAPRGRGRGGMNSPPRSPGMRGRGRGRGGRGGPRPPRGAMRDYR
jgi:ribonuclease P/MRP protein subunit RPP25